MPEVRIVLYERGYILIEMGGGITGFIQANDTDMHRSLKALHRNEETDLMLKMLVDKNKVSAPKRDDLINMLMSAWKNIKIDFAAVFMKKLHVTNALD